MARTPIKDLSLAAVDVTSTDYDFSEGWCEDWEYFAADECGECGKVLCCTGENQHCDLDPDTECEGWLSCDGPMMNYYYELPGFEYKWRDVDAAAIAIAHLPLVIVQFTRHRWEEEYALALSGGGMDLSWEICEAFMQLGYVPPMAFIDLPDYRAAYDKHHRWILAGCQRSAEVKSRESLRYVQKVRDLRKSMRDRHAARAA